MKMKQFGKLTEAEKTIVTSAIIKTLENKVDISFAYIHGSFLKRDFFHDIDVAVFLREVPESFLQYELALEAECMAAIGRYPVDVRVLNTAPLSFRYHVIKEGIRALVKRDSEARTAFEEATLAHYFDFAPYRAQYLKETLGVGV